MPVESKGLPHSTVQFYGPTAPGSTDPKVLWFVIDPNMVYDPDRAGGGRMLSLHVENGTAGERSAVGYLRTVNGISGSASQGHRVFYDSKLVWVTGTTTSQGGSFKVMRNGSEVAELDYNVPGHTTDITLAGGDTLAFETVGVTQNSHIHFGLRRWEANP